MKIGITCYPTYGGSGVVATELGIELANRGHHVHFIAYQQGPYGFADVESDIQKSLHIPSADIIIQTTHTHNGPDDLGVWGGVPDSYLAFEKSQIESAITQAVRSGNFNSNMFG